MSDLVWDMATELTNQGHEAHIIAAYATNNTPDARVHVHRFSVPPMGYRNVIGNIWLLRRAAAVVRRLSPDIVHCPEYLSTAVLAHLRVPIPLVLTVPGNIYHRMSTADGSSYEWHYAQVLKWAARVSASRCSAIIAISEEMKMWWERTGSDPAHTPVIPLGFSRSRFQYIQDARERLHLDDRVMFLYVGRLSREKGVMTLLEAVNEIPEGIRRTLQVVCVGDGPERDVLTRRVGTWALESVIRFVPWINQDLLSVWYSAADAVILPSYTEGFSRVIVESLACGTPVIGTRISGTEDHVSPGETGFLFQRSNVEELKNIIIKTTKNPQILADLRSASYSYAQKNLGWPSVMERVVREVYEPLIVEAMPLRRPLHWRIL